MNWPNSCWSNNSLTLVSTFGSEHGELLPQANRTVDNKAKAETEQIFIMHLRRSAAPPELKKDVKRQRLDTFASRNDNRDVVVTSAAERESRETASCKGEISRLRDNAADGVVRDQIGEPVAA